MSLLFSFYYFWFFKHILHKIFDAAYTCSVFPIKYIGNRAKWTIYCTHKYEWICTRSMSVAVDLFFLLNTKHRICLLMHYSSFVLRCNACSVWKQSTNPFSCFKGPVDTVLHAFRDICFLFAVGFYHCLYIVLCAMQATMQNMKIFSSNENISPLPNNMIDYIYIRKFI